MKNIIIVCLLLCSLGCLGQGIVPVEEPSITQLVERHIELNRNERTVEGWRIQIYATTDRSQLEVARGEFMSLYPSMPVDWAHASPWYRLRAGAYASKLEATYALNQLKEHYKEAYLANDRFRPEELLK